MDNIEIIFILIAIFSLISAVFKKLKKKGGTAPPGANKPNASADRRKKAPEELLEEFFGIKITKEGETPAEQKVSVKSVPELSNSSTWNPEDEFTDILE
jgi:hypothetical protein